MEEMSMFKYLIATTASIALMSGVAFAQSTTTTPAPADNQAEAPVKSMELFKGAPGSKTAADMSAMTKVEEGQLLASGFMGKDVYNGDGSDAESIGKLSDLIIGPDGMVQAAVIGVGGFLGVGQKNVAIPANQLKLSIREDKSSWIVVDTTKDKLQAAPSFETSDNFTEGVADPAKANENASETPTTPPADTTTAPVPMAPADSTAPAETTAPAAPAPAEIAPAPATPAPAN
jgi:hypothetical protein